MQRKTLRGLGAFLLLLAGWALIGGLVVPELIKQAYLKQSFGFINQLIKGQAKFSVEHYLSVWHSLYLASLGVVPTALVVLFTLRRVFCRPSTFYQVLVPPADSFDLGVMRAIVFSIISLNVCWEDLPSVRLVPVECALDIGVMGCLHSLPFWTDIYQNYFLLVFLKGTTLILAMLAALGYQGRWITMSAALAYMIFGGILRAHTGNYHFGLVPLYLALMLSVMPSTDGFSLDQRAGRTYQKSHEVYGWCRYYCWISIASVYCCSGISKIRYGGLTWYEGANLKRIVMRDSLNPMQFEWGMESFLATIPEFWFSIAGAGALLIESTFFLVLLYRWARIFYPLAVVGMHLGILVGQGILFLDMILVQSLFVGWSTILLKPSETAPKRSDFSSSRPRFSHSAWMAGAGILTMVNALIFTFEVEYYPLSAWKMYTQNKRDDYVFYNKVYAIDHDGNSKPFYPESIVGALADTRYRKVLPNEQRARQIFQAILDEYNRRHPNRPIERIEVRGYQWKYSDRNLDFYKTPVVTLVIAKRGE